MKLIIQYGILICIFTLSSSVFAQQSRSELIAIFKKEIVLNDNYKIYAINLHQKDSSGIFQDTLIKNEYEILRKKTENYHKDIFTPALNTAKNIICKKKDKLLLRHFFKVIISDTNSTDEGLLTSLQETFICQTNLFISEYNQSTEQDKPIILRQLCIYFDAVPYQKGTLHPDFSIINSKLLNVYKQQRTP